MTLGELIERAQKELENAGIETARLDAEVLLAHAAKKDRTWLCSERNSNADENILKQFESFTARRKQRCPVAYITGEKEFWSIPIKVTPDVLIPRPETELVVEQALKIIQKIRNPGPETRDPKYNILDLCCGSGCIVAALAREMPSAHFVCADKSQKAIEVAKENLAFAPGRVKFLCGDLFKGISGKFDLIVSNPPYGSLAEKSSLAREITEYEPQMAVFGGKDGLDFIRRIIKNAPRYLKTGGWLIMEMGFGQTNATKELVRKTGAYTNFSVHKDLAGIERVVSVRKS